MDADIFLLPHNPHVRKLRIGFKLWFQLFPRNIQLKELHAIRYTVEFYKRENIHQMQSQTMASIKFQKCQYSQRITINVEKKF